MQKDTFHLRFQSLSVPYAMYDRVNINCSRVRACATILFNMTRMKENVSTTCTLSILIDPASQDLSPSVLQV